MKNELNLLKNVTIMIGKKGEARKTLDQFIVDLDQYVKVRDHCVSGNFMGNIKSSAIYRNIESNDQVLIKRMK